jgi:hypothetical protein
MSTGTRVELEHADRGHLVLDLTLADWVGWESWAGRSFVTFGDEDNPPGIKDVTYLAFQAAVRTGVHVGDFEAFTRLVDGFPQFKQGPTARPTPPEASESAA